MSKPEPEHKTFRTTWRVRTSQDTDSALYKALDAVEQKALSAHGDALPPVEIREYVAC